MLCAALKTSMTEFTNTWISVPLRGRDLTARQRKIMGMTPLFYQLPEDPPPPDDPPPPEKLELLEDPELPEDQDPPDPPELSVKPPMEALPFVLRLF